MNNDATHLKHDIGHCGLNLNTIIRLTLKHLNIIALFRMSYNLYETNISVINVKLRGSLKNLVH